MKKLLLLLSAIFLSLNFISYNPTENVEGKFPYEEFNPELSILDNMDKLIYYIDNLALQKNIPVGSVEYAVLCEKVVKERFIWGYTFYSLKENWIAAIAGKLIWTDLAGIVNPNYILKHKAALCSQQGLVVGEVFKRKGMLYRVCGFVALDKKGREINGHFAIETKVGENWYYIDPTLEPTIDNEIRNQNNWFCNRKFFSSFFPNSEAIMELSQNIMLGRPNAEMAKNNKIFQEISWYLSRVLWLFPLIFMGFLYFKEFKKN